VSGYRPGRFRRVVAKNATTGEVKLPKVKRVHKQLGALKLILRSMGLEFVEEYRFHEKRMWRFDLAIPSLKLAIEYQGHGQTGKAKGQGEHIGGHASHTGLATDCEKDLHALLGGWRVMKFTAIHFTPAKRAEFKLTAPLDAIRLMVESLTLNQWNAEPIRSGGGETPSADRTPESP